MFPRVFSVNHNYKSNPLTEENHETCSTLTKSCCQDSSGEFYDLKHYWENVNYDQNFSYDMRKFYDEIYYVLVKYQEIWMTKMKNLLKHANLDPKY